MKNLKVVQEIEVPLTPKSDIDIENIRRSKFGLCVIIASICFTTHCCCVSGAFRGVDTANINLLVGIQGKFFSINRLF